MNCNPNILDRAKHGCEAVVIFTNSQEDKYGSIFNSLEFFLLNSLKKISLLYAK